MRWIAGLFFIVSSHVVMAMGSSGIIEGKLGWPSEKEFFPLMKVCAENVNTKKISCLDLNKRNYEKTEYKWKLPVGTYFIYSQLLHDEADTSARCRAYYSEFITCGTKVDCKSHKPIAVTVKSGITLKNIDPYDWYNESDLSCRVKK